MNDYRKLVSRTPPEGLLGYAGGHLDTAGLVYEIVWLTDRSMEALLTDNLRKYKVVRCTCSECERSTILDYVPKNGHPHYGFRTHVEQGMEEVRDGDSCLCPMCGAPVKVRCAATVGRGTFVTAETMVMSVSLLPGESARRPLVLTGWRIRRLVNRNGRERYEIQPLEAYVFEEKAAYKLNGWRRSYSGYSGYSVQVSAEWRQPKDWSETWGRCTSIFGLTSELVAESCLYNSKFDLYMKRTFRTEWKSPVPYLRLYQTYPQVENLVVQGYCHILDGLFERKMRVDYWEGNYKAMTSWPEINFEETRPAQMLGLTKEELGWMKEQCWDLFHWEIFVKAKKVGDRMRPDDMTALHRYGGEDVECLIGQAPLGKCVRYLLGQIADWSAANDPYNEYADYVPDEDTLTADMLNDYWRMAGEAGWNLDDPAVRWPKDLIAAHDRAMAARKAKLNERLAEHFKARFAELGRYAYASGGLMIIPALNQQQLNDEGSILHHCVSGYGERHAKGKTAIFFIRHTWEPETPYFTLELDEEKKTVKQNRGRFNCARTDEVKVFEESWLSWMHGGCQRRKDGTPVGAAPVLTRNPAEIGEENKAV